ncbi:hypothetical protein HELRODRAFT_145141, partial [Helobdella robusta]|uniref:Fibrinogen C-terminal domain-containing protein n=1 Tax=Helobdella robusta TaxID=6412 RepID=T1EJI8_HELRO
WILIHQRLDSTVWSPFGWSSYRNGFGSISTAYYWFGLEPIYQLVSAKQYMLKIEVQLTNGLYFVDQYSTFNLKDEAGKYALHTSGWTGTNTDIFDYSLLGCRPDGQKFSTYDNDNDGLLVNCASQNGGGWWF